MNYSDIIPTHNTLRNPDSFRYFRDDISKIFTAKRKPLILKMEDGSFYLNDGHHRLVAAYVACVKFDYLEFDFMDMTYAKMEEMNFNVGWVTPYYPRVKVRRNDCLKFKTMILDYFNASTFPDEAKKMSKLIASKFPEMYLEDRTSHSLKDLIPNAPYLEQRT